MAATKAFFNISKGNPRILIGALLVVTGLVICLVEVFQIPYFSSKLVGQAYLFSIIAMFMPLAFYHYFPPLTGWFKYYRDALAVLTFGIAIYFMLNSETALYQGWEVIAPLHAQILGLCLILLVLVAMTRIGGLPLFIIVLLFGILPVLSDYLPTFLSGKSYSFWSTVTFHAMGSESLLGIPMRVVARILIGYLVFGVLLMETGGGKFFYDFAISLMGRYRGGPAKVSVISSAFFGSISGSAVANIITTGSFTIPSMKRNGFPSHYAAAIEAAASTGGTLTPPIMGATAFIMTEFLNISYLEVCIAAMIPAFLYFLTLLLQVDCYAGKNKLSGLSKEEITPLSQVLKDGWPFAVSFIVLLGILGIFKANVRAPFYTSAVLLGLLTFQKKNRLAAGSYMKLIDSIGRTIANIMVTLLGVGLIMGSLSMTGLAYTFSSDLGSLAGGSTILLLLLGAGGSFILGMGMTISACYVFLVLIVAPPLLEAGFNPVASHLFFLYCGMLSYITPPVAIASLSAASLAEAPPMKTAFKSIQIGIAKFILPFAFILSPALIFQGEFWEGVLALVLTTLGLIFIAQGAEGFWLLKSKVIGLPARTVLIIAGIILIFYKFIFS